MKKSAGPPEIHAHALKFGWNNSFSCVMPSGAVLLPGEAELLNDENLSPEHRAAYWQLSEEERQGVLDQYSSGSADDMHELLLLLQEHNVGASSVDMHADQDKGGWADGERSVTTSTEYEAVWAEDDFSGDSGTGADGGDSDSGSWDWGDWGDAGDCGGGCGGD